LTDGEITGAGTFSGTKQGYDVTNQAASITKEFSGRSYDSTASKTELQLTISGGAHVDTLINLRTTGGTFPVFARYKNGTGSTLVLGFENTAGAEQLVSAYYNTWGNMDKFMYVIPEMMFVRFAGGDECWHNDHNYANFQVDDPVLRQSALNYSGILPNAIAHNFHMTVYFVSGNVTSQQEQSVVDLFLSNPDYFSVDMHGNTHAGPGWNEFCAYGMYPGTDYECRTQQCQDDLIRTGVDYMNQLTATTGIPWGRVLGCPGCGLREVETFGICKKYNLNGVMAGFGCEVPDGVTAPSDNDYHMVPADFTWDGFPMARRYSSVSSGPGTNDPYRREFDLFLDKSVCMYAHPPELNADVALWNPIADDVNAIVGGVEWKDMGYLWRHLYWEKTNDDGTIDVRMFSSSELEILNETAGTKTYNVRKPETGEWPIGSVKVNGVNANYTVAGENLTIDPFDIGAGNSKTVQIICLSVEDTTPPGAPAVVRDGTTGPDIDSTSLATQLSANWDMATDPESSIWDYKYAIATTAGGTDVVGWTSTSNGTVTSVTRTGLSLSAGTVYYFTVKAVNGAGLESNATNSDGQMVEESEPDDINVKVYPNPLVVSEGGQITFSVGDATGGEVKIYTLSGKLVKELAIETGESEVNWDVLNEDGNSITAGLYLYTIIDGAGNKKTGKLAISD
jgi:hypothetical protein